MYEAGQKKSGRRYRLDVPYLLPKDMQEINRLDFQHFALRSAMGARYFAPVSRSEKLKFILDIGSGTGAWCFDMCKEYPEARVYGLDIEHVVKPEMPSNYTFVEGNVLQRLPFKNDSFDFVHQRDMNLAIPIEAWPSALGELKRVTRAGGWLEWVDDSGRYGEPAGAVTEQITGDIARIAAERGIDTRAMEKLEPLLEQLGFVNIQRKTIAVPIGRWGGRAGSLMATNLLAIMGSFKDIFVQKLKYTPEYFDSLLVTISSEWEERRSRYTMYVYCAQKP